MPSPSKKLRRNSPDSGVGGLVEEQTSSVAGYHDSMMAYPHHYHHQQPTYHNDSVAPDIVINEYGQSSSTHSATEVGEGHPAALSLLFGKAISATANTTTDSNSNSMAMSMSGAATNNNDYDESNVTPSPTQMDTTYPNIRTHHDSLCVLSAAAEQLRSSPESNSSTSDTFVYTFMGATKSVTASNGTSSEKKRGRKPAATTSVTKKVKKAAPAKAKAKVPAKAKTPAKAKATTNAAAASSKKKPKQVKRAPPVPTVPDVKEQERIMAAIFSVSKMYGNMTESEKTLAWSKLRGVTMRASGKWQAQIYYGTKSRYIGVFETKEKAALAYEMVREVLKSDTKKNNGKQQDINDDVDEEESKRIFKVAVKAAYDGVYLRKVGAEKRIWVDNTNTTTGSMNEKKKMNSIDI